MRLDDYFPTVLSFEPNLKSSNVSNLPEIIIRFNIELQEESLNSNEKLNRYIILAEESTDSTIPVEFISYQNKVLKFKPSVELNPGSTYQVTVLRKIISSDGRNAKQNRSFVFKVSQTEIPKVNLLEPPDLTSESSIVNFTWAPVTVSSTGDLVYRIEVDDNSAFRNIYTNGWTTTTPNTEATIGVSLSPHKSYFWRVRAELYTTSGSSVGEWSSPFTFYYGTFFDPTPSSRQTYPKAVPFQSSFSEEFENGASNLPNYPNLNLKFPSPVNPLTVNDQTIYLLRESVDGWPDSSKNRVGLTLAVSGNTIYVTPTEPIVVNSRYTLVVTGDVESISGAGTEPEKRYFTSRYSPLYLGANVLRANFGEFLVNIPDDFINFHIFRVSLDINRHRIFFSAPFAGGPTEQHVRNLTINLTYAMERWVEHESAVRLLQARYYELLEEADVRKRLGDYEEQHGATILKSLSDEITRQKKLALYWVSQFSFTRARVRNVVKSERRPEWMSDTDLSFRRFRRTKYNV